MQAVDTHVCLVSGQPSPNLIPLLDEKTAPKRVILVTSTDMSRQADHLSSVIEPRGIDVQRLPIKDAWSFNDMFSSMVELVDREKREGHNPALNATGGTKLMSMAAYEVFRESDQPIFYVHPEKGECMWLWPRRESHRIQAKMDLETFLGAHGAKSTESIDRNRLAPGLLDVARALVRHTAHNQTLSYLCKLATSAENNGLCSDPVAADMVHRSTFNDLIDLLVDKALVERDGKRLRFNSRDDIQFVKGGWLEGYVYDAVRNVVRNRTEVQDTAKNVVARRERGSKTIENELDVAVLARNRLHVIECKARKWSIGEERPTDETLEADVLYKLNSITDALGGLQARGMVVSYLRFKDSHRRRAAEMRIQICAGNDLHRLEEMLRAFLEL